MGWVSTVFNSNEWSYCRSFGICLLNSKANPAQFHKKWAGLAALFSRQFPNGFHIFFSDVIKEYLKLTEGEEVKIKESKVLGKFMTIF